MSGSDREGTESKLSNPLTIRGLTMAYLVSLPAEALKGLTFALFVLVTIFPVLRRVFHPSILGDDIIRLVNLIELPMRDVFRSPGFQHVTPFFDLVSWTTWQVVGRDVRWAPLGYTIASVLPWTLVLGLFGTWLIRETRSHTAAFLSLAVVSQSPLVMETMGWYSASSFSWAIAGILLAMLVAEALPVGAGVRWA